MEGNHIEKPASDLNDANGKEVLRLRIDTVSDVVEAVALEFVGHWFSLLAAASHVVLGLVVMSTTQAQRPGARDATIATATLSPGMVERSGVVTDCLIVRLQS